MLAATTPAVSVSSRRPTVAVRCSAAKPDTRRTRRAMLLAGLAGVSAAVVLPNPPAQARDYKDALAKKEARKLRLKEAAGQIKSSGQDQQVFKKSAYSMPEDSTTPNVHSRQNEGARTQENV